MITDFNDIKTNRPLTVTNNILLSEADAYKKMGIMAGTTVAEVDVKKVLQNQKFDRDNEPK